jgi:hypothetical protein
MGLLSNIWKAARNKIRGLLDFTLKAYSNPFSRLERWRLNRFLFLPVSLLVYLFSFLFRGEFYTKVDGQFLYAFSGRPGKNNSLFYSDNHEYNVSSLFCNLLDEGIIVVDVGASLGYYTLLSAKRVGEDGLVVAFEPDPAIFEVLVKNIRANNWQNVEAFRLAVSDSNTKVKIRSFSSFPKKILL